MKRYKFFLLRDSKLVNKFGEEGEWKVGEWKTYVGQIGLYHCGFHVLLNKPSEVEVRAWGNSPLALVECQGLYQGDGTYEVWQKMRILKIL